VSNSVTLATKLKQEDLKEVVKKLSTLLFLCFIVASVILSCNKKPEAIGLDLVDDNAAIAGFDTTIEISAYSKIEEPIPSDETSLSMAGSMTTSTFGQTTASFYTHIRTSLLNPDFGENPEADSIVFTMVYDGAYGNLNSEQNFKVFRVGEDINFDSTYYSNALFKSAGSIYADYTFTPDTTREVLVDTSNQVDTTYQAARLKMYLNDQFAQDIFDLDTAVWNSNEDFLSAFKGLYIKPENISNTGEGGILYFDLITDYSNITIYYHNVDEDSLALRFLINLNCARVGKFEHDYSLSSYPNFVLNNDSTIEGSDRLFLQGLAGVKSEISFPGIKNWVDSGNIVINEAKLILSVEDYEPEYSPSSSLVMFKNIDSDSNMVADGYDFMRDQLQGDSYFGGQYNESAQTYTYRISLHMQDLLAGEVDLGVALFPTAKAVKANEIKLFGTNPSIPGRLKLNIIYTKVE